MSTLTPHPTARKSLYFNITLACNSRCEFCASNSSGGAKGYIPVAAIHRALESFPLVTEDDVIINGGEPTTHPNLPWILDVTCATGARVTLFTNGRRLCKDDYLDSLGVDRLHRLSIPLHGASPATHDRLVGVLGGQRETLQGLRNLGRRCEAGNGPTQLEIKLLALRPSLAEWSQALELILETVGRPDRLLLSGLILSRTLLERGTSLIPTFDELFQAVNGVLHRACQLDVAVMLWCLPLCAIDLSNRQYIDAPEPLVRIAPLVSDDEIYFDPRYPDGVTLADSGDAHARTTPRCLSCPIANACSVSDEFAAALFQ